MNAHYVDNKESRLLKQIGDKLDKAKMVVGTAESCTGGRIASMISSQPGSSEHFMGGIVSYSEEVKKNVLGVPAKDIEKYGIVSRQVAEQMASGACRVLDCQCAVATTGVAGPDGGSAGTPVGTVWVAVTVGDITHSECLHLEGDRQEIVRQASCQALSMLLEILK